MQTIKLEPNYKSLFDFIRQTIIDNSKNERKQSTTELLTHFEELAIYLHAVGEINKTPVLDRAIKPEDIEITK